MADERMFQEAVEAIERGQNDRARDLLTRMLKEEKKNADLWLYMSTVVETDKERVFCLENALKVDPKNQAASRGLVLLGAKLPDPRLSPVKPVRQREWDPGMVLSLTGDPVVDGGPRTRLPIFQLAGFALIGFIAVALIWVGLFGNPFAEGGLGYIILADSGELFETLTPTLDATEQASSLARGQTPTFVGPTPLAFLLENTHTPTPRYVDTPHPSSEAYTSALRAYDLGNYETAIERFQQHLDDFPGDVDARYYMGLCYLELGEVLDAEKAFLQVINIDPDFGPGYLGAALAEQARNPEAAIGEKLNTAIGKDPTFIDAYLVRAEYFLFRKNTESALLDIEKILELDPQNPIAFNLKARILLAQGDFQDALVAAQTANAYDPTLEESYLTLGIALVELGQLEEALGPLQTFLAFNEENGEGWLYLGRAQQAFGLHENAIEIFNKAKELQNDLFEVDYYKAQSLLALGEYEEAMPLFENTVRIFPDWFEAQIGWGITLLETGEPGEAYFKFNGASSLAKSDEQKAALYYWRALSLEGLGDHTSANFDWQRLLDLPQSAIPQGWAATAVQYQQGLGGTITPAEDAPTRVPTVTPSPTP